MDLFAAADGVVSGEVPREVWPGVVWDEIAEDMFGELFLDWASRFPAVAHEERARASALQSARWAVELHLLHQTIHRESARAAALLEAADKRRLHTEWLRTFGAKFTERLVRGVKDPALCSPHLGRSL